MLGYSFLFMQFKMHFIESIWSIFALEHFYFHFDIGLQPFQSKIKFVETTTLVTRFGSGVGRGVSCSQYIWKKPVYLAAKQVFQWVIPPPTRRFEDSSEEMDSKVTRTPLAAQLKKNSIRIQGTSPPCTLDIVIKTLWTSHLHNVQVNNNMNVQIHFNWNFKRKNLCCNRDSNPGPSPHCSSSLYRHLFFFIDKMTKPVTFPLMFNLTYFELKWLYIYATWHNFRWHL